MICIFIAEGFEETEAVTPVDILRRARHDVKMVGVGGKRITSSHGITVECDMTEDELVLDENIEMIILPGGLKGVENLEASGTVARALDYCTEHDIFIGAICAAPRIIGDKGIADGKKAVCYRGFEDRLKGADVSYEPAVIDGKLITARGAGVSVDFALKLVEALDSKALADEIADKVMIPKDRY